MNRNHVFPRSVSTHFPCSRVLLLVGSQPCQARPLLLFVARVGRHARHSALRRCRLHQLLIRGLAVLVKQNIQSLLIDSSFWKFNLENMVIRWNIKIHNPSEFLYGLYICKSDESVLTSFWLWYFSSNRICSGLSVSCWNPNINTTACGWHTWIVTIDTKVPALIFLSKFSDSVHLPRNTKSQELTCQLFWKDCFSTVL